MKLIFILALTFFEVAGFAAQTNKAQTYSLREMTESEHRSYHSQQRAMFGSGPFVWEGKMVWLVSPLRPELLKKCKGRYKVTGLMGALQSELMIGEVSQIDCD